MRVMFMKSSHTCSASSPVKPKCCCVPKGGSLPSVARARKSNGVAGSVRASGNADLGCAMPMHVNCALQGMTKHYACIDTLTTTATRIYMAYCITLHDIALHLIIQKYILHYVVLHYIQLRYITAHSFYQWYRIRRRRRFNDRKPIGEVSCCDSFIAGRPDGPKGG